jgi:hypothetical protein
MVQIRNVPAEFHRRQKRARAAKGLIYSEVRGLMSADRQVRRWRPPGGEELRSYNRFVTDRPSVATVATRSATSIGFTIWQSKPAAVARA